MSRDIHNLGGQRGLRRALRRRATPAERSLWRMIRKRQIEGQKFRRQYGLGPYIVDFFCPELGLAIELDGLGHEHPEQMLYDRERTKYLGKHGISVLRFENRLVLEEPQYVLEVIRLRVVRSPPSGGS